MNFSICGVCLCEALELLVRYVNVNLVFFQVVEITFDLLGHLWLMVLSVNSLSETWGARLFKSEALF